MAKLADKESTWNVMRRRFKKQLALERIRRQPFYRPGEVFHMGGPQWSLEQIQFIHSIDLYKRDTSRICGMDMAAPGGDQTSVSVWRNQPSDPVAEYAERQGRIDAVSRRMAAMVRNIQVRGEDLSTRAYRASANRKYPDW